MDKDYDSLNTSNDFDNDNFCRFDLYEVDEDGDEIGELPFETFASKDEAIACAKLYKENNEGSYHVVCVPLGDDDDPDFMDEWFYNVPDYEPWEVVWSPF